MRGQFVRLAVASGIAGSLGLCLSAPAFADPGQGQALQTNQYSCDGQPTTVTNVPGGGVAGFKDGGVYVLDSITVTEDGTVVYSKDWGPRNGAGTPITCTAAEGSYSTTLVASPVGPAAKS